jgi:hypothetical protein
VVALAFSVLTCGTRAAPAPAPPDAPAPAASTSAPSTGKAPTPRRTGRAIFDEELARKNWPGLLPSRREKFWTPSTDDVVALERRLPAFLLSQPDGSNARENDLWLRAPNYLRQYVGITRKGRRVVYANFFCSRSVTDPDWRVSPVIVLDGGACYFQVEYDVETGVFSRLMVNGYA